MEFHDKRRQAFLSELGRDVNVTALKDSIEYFSSNPHGSGRDSAERDMLGRMSAAHDRMRLFLLNYTAGEPIDPLRHELEQVVTAYERYGELLWTNMGDRNEVVFVFPSLDDYCELMQIIGLCFLLHRRDLLERVAALQDGVDAVGQKGEGNGGTDTLYEEFLAYGLGAATRYETDHLCCSKPYEVLFHALTEPSHPAQMKELDAFLRRWYKDLAGTGWHDSHKPNEGGGQHGYFGYWSFEAGAAVVLLGIEDDSALHKYLYYPKDLVAWSRSHAALSERGGANDIVLRAVAGESCPRNGHWSTPARVDSRRAFRRGEPMPEVGSDYGKTIWQWDARQ